MMDKKDFQRLKKHYDDEDVLREKIIKQSRDILKLSKQAIYSVHGNELSNAGSLLKNAKLHMTDMKKLVTKTQSLESVGAYNAAASEFAEAQAFYVFAKTGRILKSSEIAVSNENYLLGMCDLTGELGRRAVLLAIAGKAKDVRNIRDAVEELFGEFLKFNFRNSELRKKSDSIKWNLKRIEEIVYDLSMKNK